MIDPSQAVFIEYCHNCSQHSWCTKHDEARYFSLFTLIKTSIEKEFPSLTVYGNTHPAIGKPMNPTLGAFEVTFNKHRIFSKLKTRTWPMTKQIIASIQAILDGQNPTDYELVDYSSIPYGDKPKSSAGLPSSRRSFLPKGGYLQHDGPVRTLSRNELETISCHSPGLVKTPRKQAASSLGRVDTTNTTSRPGTSNYMPSLKSTFSHRPPTGNNQNINYLSVNDVKGKPYYLPQDVRRKSAPDVDVDAVGTLPELKPSIVMGIATNNSYLNISETNENVPSHRSFVDVPNIIVSPKIGSIANELSSMYRNQALADSDVDRQLSAELTTVKRHVRSYSQEVNIKQTRDLENNEYTVFTQQRLQEERESAANYRSSPARKMYKRATWFPDCQRQNSSPERLVRGVNFEEKLKPFTNLRRPDSGKKDSMPVPTKGMGDKGKGSSSYSTMLAKTIANLRKLEFPDEKLSQIEVPKNKISKKKITVVPDSERPCKMEVYCTIPGIVGPEFAGISVPRGGALKIPLKFEGKEMKDCFIYLLKDGRPWQKIIMDLYLV